MTKTANMATRYTAELLLYLRDSPLCVKPSNLPPAAEWMGYVAGQHCSLKLHRCDSHANQPSFAERLPKPFDNSPSLLQNVLEAGLVTGYC